MKVIKEQDIIDSIADACQYISYFHPEDFVKGMVEAYEVEKSEAAKNAIGQILINSKTSFARYGKLFGKIAIILASCYCTKHQCRLVRCASTVQRSATGCK